jgi:hypothetical protein
VCDGDHSPFSAEVKKMWHYALTRPSLYGKGRYYLCLSSLWNAVNYTTGVLTSTYKAYSSITAWISSSADLLVMDIQP